MLTVDRPAIAEPRFDALELDVSSDFSSWICTDPVPAERRRAIAREMSLNGCKWDVQLGDTAVLAPFALVLPEREWRRLAALAEALTQHLAVLESALQARSELWPELGLPRRLLNALQGNDAWTPAAARIVRYDFHPTSEGWAVSEVNSDVPGGLTEAALLPRLFAESFPGLRPAGDPLAELEGALANACRGVRRVVALSAPGYTEDLQVVSGLARPLAARGVEVVRARPEQLAWRDGCAFVRCGEHELAAGAIYRFYQGEWLAELEGTDFRPLLRGGLTPVCNPARAILSESKRLPLLAGKLAASTVWSRLFAPVSSPLEAALRLGAWLRESEPAPSARPGWVFKPAYCNTGDRVISAGWQSRGQLALGVLASLARPRAWVAQRRFRTLALETPLGPLYPCVGVYTVDGRAAGLYVRLSKQPVVDYLAQDVAALIAS